MSHREYKMKKILLIGLFFYLLLVCVFYYVESERFNLESSYRQRGEPIQKRVDGNDASANKILDIPIEKVPLYRPSIITVPQTSIKLYSAHIDNRTQFYGPAIYVLGIQLAKVWNKTELFGLVTYNINNRYTSECIGPSIVSLPCGFKCNRFTHRTKYDTVNYIFKVHRLKINSLPTTISLSLNNNCSQLSQQIKIYNYQPTKMKTIGVCLQTPLYGNIATKTIVKFIEIHRILGVEKFTMYSQLSSDAKRDSVLQTYQSEGILELVPWSSEFKRFTPVHYYGEVLVIHDCLYRNMNYVKYLSFVDLDEVIVPRYTTSLLTMIESIKKPATKVFFFHNTYYIENSTANNPQKEQIDYFTKIYRLACNYRIFRRSKVIVVPTAVNNVDIHGVYLPVRKKGTMMHVPVSVGSLFHYRNQISSDCENRTLIYDPIMLQYKDALFKRLIASH